MLERTIAALELGNAPDEAAEAAALAKAETKAAPRRGEDSVSVVAAHGGEGRTPPKGKLAEVVREFAAKLLREAGRPLSRGELLKGLEALGIHVDGENPPKKIGRILWEAKEDFAHVGTGYWFTNEDVPQA